MQTVRHVELAVLRQKRADAALRIQVNHRHGIAVADFEHRSHVGDLRQPQMVGLVACRNILLVFAARLARRHKHQLCLRRARRDGADQVVERTVELVHVRAAQLSQRHVTAKVVNAAKDDADICRVIDAVQALDKRIATVGLDGNTRTLNTKVLDRSAAQQRTQVRSPGDIVASPAASVIAPGGRIAKAADGRFAQVFHFHILLLTRTPAVIQVHTVHSQHPRGYAWAHSATCESSHSISSARCATPRWCPPGQTSCRRFSSLPSSA